MAELQIDHEQLPRIAEEFGLRFIALFGSAAKGRMTGESDLDLAVWADPLPESDDERAEWRMGLDAALSRAVPHGGGVDVVVLNRVRSLLQFEVARYGVVLHERTAGAWSRFKSYAARRYDDDAPFRERVHEYLMRAYAP